MDFLGRVVNLFYNTDLFWYPLKTSENLWFSDVFGGLGEGGGVQGVSKEISGMKLVNRCSFSSINDSKLIYNKRVINVSGSM